MRNNRHGLVQHLQSWAKLHHVDADAILVVGVSGGLDSMVLAETCLRAGFNLHVAHINYGLRGGESDGDATAVQSWCEAAGIPFFAHQAKIEKAPDGIQAEARKIRYAFFESLRIQLAETTGLNAYVVTAHHANDQAETVMLQLMRSSNPLSLSGMRPHDAKRHLLRPFLTITKSQLAAYARDWDVSFREDSSNAKHDYLRNRIRHEALPQMESMREGTNEHLARWAERFQPIATYLQSEIEQARSRCWESLEDGGVLHLDAWIDEPLHMEVLFGLAQDHKIGARAVREVAALTERLIESGAAFQTAHVRIVRKKRTLHWTVLP